MAEMDTPLLIQTMQAMIQSLDRTTIALGGGRGDDNFADARRKRTNIQNFKEQAKDPIKENADQQRIQKALQENTKALKDTWKGTNDYNKDFKLTSAAFQKSVEKMSTAAFDDLPRRINDLTSKYEFNFKTKADIDKAIALYDEASLKRMRELVDIIEDETSTIEDSIKATEELERKGWDLKEVFSKTADEFQKKGEALGQALKKDTEATNAHAEETKKVTGFLKFLGATALVVADQKLQEYQASAHLGVGLDGLGISAVMLGMSQENLAKMQNENLRGIRASGESIDHFNQRLKDSSRDLLMYAGSLEGGAHVASQAIKVSRMLTSNVAQQDKYVKESVGIFKLMNATTGETWEQFNALSDSLLNNQSVQTNMYRLTESQRAQADIELKQTAAYLNTMGLLDDETKSVVATFAELGAQGPKERRKAAAQVAAVGGALGISNAGEIAQMIARGETGTARFAELVGGAQQQLQAQYAANKNEAGEYSQYALTNLSPQVAALFGQGGGAGLLGTRQGNALNAADIGKAVAEAQQKQQSKLEAAALEGNDISKAILGKGIIQIAKEALELVIGLKWIKNFLGKGGATAATEAGEAGVAGGLARGLASTGLKGTLKTFGGKLPIVGALISGGITYAETGDVKQAAGNTAGTYGGAAVGGLTGAAIGSVIPIVGTAIGGLIGAGIGGYFGGDAGQNLVKHFEKAEPTKAEEKMDENDKEQLKVLKDMDEKLQKLTNDKSVEKQTDEMKKQHQKEMQMTQEQIDAYNKAHLVRINRTSTQLGSGI